MVPASIKTPSVWLLKNCEPSSSRVVPLCPRKRTFGVGLPTSAKCQKPTSSATSIRRRLKSHARRARRSLLSRQRPSDLDNVFLFEPGVADRHDAHNHNGGDIKSTKAPDDLLISPAFLW